MSEPTRRQLIGYGLGTMGLLLARPLLASHSTTQPASAPTAAAAKAAPSLPVSIQRCASYEPKLLREKLDAAFDQVGGIRGLLNGKTVTIKINYTGGPGKLGGLPGERTYQNHPLFVAATCAAFRDAGAKRIVIVESMYSSRAPEEVLAGAGWDIPGIKAAGGNVSFEDTRNRGAFRDYATLKVPWGGYLYPAFMVHKRYEETDVFVSMAKLKDHVNAGVTLSVKNLFGLPPTSLYGGDAPNENSRSNRGAILHSGSRKVPGGVPAALDVKMPDPGWKSRVPRVTADLAGARPIDLAIIDGIETNRGGEGPWCRGVEPLSPRLLIVGRNAVCTDAVATAVMGYDPQAPHFQFPFPGENHLLLLANAGVGTIDPAKIEVRGLSLKEALFPFNPRRLPLG